MGESTLNRVIFRSGHPWIEAHKAPPEQPLPPVKRGISGPDAGQEAFSKWAGSYYCDQLQQTWNLEFADGGLWLVPPGAAAQLLTPNGPDGMRCRAVNVWFTPDAFLLSAVDEITAAYIDNLWFEKTSPTSESNN